MAWPIEVLTRIGYDQEAAERLHLLLPPVPAGHLPVPNWNNPLVHYEGGDNPDAAIIWFLHGPPGDDAVRLANSGRDLLDVLAIMDAVAVTHPGPMWRPAKVDIASSWVAAAAISTERAARYIAAGITAREATNFEADPDTRPSDDQLALLAALRTPAEST
ncbi:hypothetical protein [Nocardioides conyzicola]|uniref:Uncharacterized protein n=1 Tax=Nocardioides conyzicola TaxID=1651781 RepID=A0ABP8XCU3_9ACTN